MRNAMFLVGMMPGIGGIYLFATGHYDGAAWFCGLSLLWTIGVIRMERNQ